MELVFNKEGNKWVAEFEAPSDFNLHIEREQVAYINIMQRGSSNGEYDLAKSFSADKTFDYDFGALVYPKFIKVVSGSEVISASVNFNEGGGSGNGSGNGAEYTYLDVRGFDMSSNSRFLNILPFVSFINYKGVLNGQDVHYIMSYGYYGFLAGDISSILGLAIDESFMTTSMKTPDSKQLCSIKEAIEMSTAKDLYNSIPRLTKEEFYNLEA